MAFKDTNARIMGLTVVSVVMTLDKPPHELNIHDYSLFSSESDMDLDKFWNQGKTLGPYDYLTTICLNYANPTCTNMDECSLSITYLPHPSAFINITQDNYFETKRKMAKDMIDIVSKHLGVNLFDHIKEIEVEMPHTIAHYTSNYMGGIYGYKHSMDDHIIARLLMADKEHYIKGLAFSGAHAISGDGMSPCITNGRNAANTLLNQMMEEGYYDKD